MTLAGEVEQGRVSGAARVGQSTDLVVAPLFPLVFIFFVSLSYFRSFSSFLFTSWILISFVAFESQKHKCQDFSEQFCLACHVCPLSSLFSVCYSSEELSGVPACPV